MLNRVWASAFSDMISRGSPVSRAVGWPVVAASLIASGQSASAMTPSQLQVIGVFKDACINGQVKLSAVDSRPVSGKEVPEYIRNFAVTKTGQQRIYRLSILPSTYLIVFGSDTPRSHDFENGCAVVTEYIDAYDFWTALTNVKAEGYRYKSAREYRLTKATEGWQLLVRRWDIFGEYRHQYTVARLGILNQTDRSRINKDSWSYTQYKSQSFSADGTP